jgi:hypothetical protein
MSELPSPRLSWRHVAHTILFTVVGLLFGCGGGADGGVGTGGTGTYAVGTISGFGSVIVNGVHFDDSSASVLDDDDATRRRDELKLGMTVAIDSDAIRSDANGRSATASRIRLGSEIVGPVGAVDTVAGTLDVLGQTVRIGPLTVFDDVLAAGLAGIVTGRSIEVYAQYDASSGRYDATRIDARDAAAPWRLRGTVAAVDTTLRRLRIGTLIFDYAAASGVPSRLVVGDIVWVRVSPAPGPFGGWAITAFGTAVRTPQDRDGAELKGRVSGYVSATQFSVDGLRVDASAARFPDGSGGVQPGARVEVVGALRGGVLRATQVSVQAESEEIARGFELRGAIEAVDAAARTFTLRGNIISWTRADLRLDDGTLADIAVGRSVEVKAQLATSRSGLEATRIKFD